MTSPQAEPPAQALGESLAALAVQVAAPARPGRADQQTPRPRRAPRRSGPRRPLRGTRPDSRRRTGRRRTLRPRRTLLDRPGPPGLCRAAGRAKAMGRHRTPPAIPRLRSPRLLVQPHPRHLGTIHPGSRMAPHLRRQTPRPGPRPGVLRPLAPQHHAPHRRHHPDMHAGMRHAPPSLVRGPRRQRLTLQAGFGRQLRSRRSRR